MSISENQRIPLPEANWVGTVYHARRRANFGSLL
jgi:hypothetical protein